MSETPINSVVIPVLDQQLPLVEYSYAKIGELWTAEDHSHLVRKLAQIDRLASDLTLRQKISPGDVEELSWDGQSVQCGNCQCQILVRGGSIEHHGLSKPIGDDLALCGYCMGMESLDLAKKNRHSGDVEGGRFERETKKRKVEKT